MDLLIPIISLVICCVIGMIYTGGFFSGTDFVTAFSQSDASVGLVLGSFFGLVITILLYMVRRVLSFRDCMACIPEGFKSMVPAILILTPILLPIVQAIGMDPIQFGVIMVVNLAIGFVTPPIGVNLFVASSLTDVPVMAIAKKAMPMIVFFLIALLPITFIPAISIGIL